MADRTDQTVRLHATGGAAHTATRRAALSRYSLCPFSVLCVYIRLFYPCLTDSPITQHPRTSFIQGGHRSGRDDFSNRVSPGSIQTRAPARATARRAGHRRRAGIQELRHTSSAAAAPASGSGRLHTGP